MSYKVKATTVFEKQAKRLIKRYASLKIELLALIAQLKENPKQGTPIAKSCYKIRLSIKSKGKGKSGGARIISNFEIHEDIVYLISIYDKSEKDDLMDGELEELLKDIPK